MNWVGLLDWYVCMVEDLVRLADRKLKACPRIPSVQPLAEAYSFLKLLNLCKREVFEGCGKDEAKAHQA